MDDIEKLIELANCRQTYGCCCSFHHCSWSLKGIVLGASIAHVRVQGTGRSCCRCAGSAKPLNPETLLYPQFVPAHLSSTVGHLLVFKVKNSADMEYRFQLLALQKALLLDLAWISFHTLLYDWKVGGATSCRFVFRSFSLVVSVTLHPSGPSSGSAEGKIEEPRRYWFLKVIEQENVIPILS